MKEKEIFSFYCVVECIHLIFDLFFKINLCFDNK